LGSLARLIFEQKETKNLMRTSWILSRLLDTAELTLPFVGQGFSFFVTFVLFCSRYVCAWQNEPRDAVNERYLMKSERLLQSRFDPLENQTVTLL
jgi:hypothetical protein